MVETLDERLRQLQQKVLDEATAEELLAHLTPEEGSLIDLSVPLPPKLVKTLRETLRDVRRGEQP